MLYIFVFFQNIQLGLFYLKGQTISDAVALGSTEKACSAQNQTQFARVDL
jgi:hypothetical protein